ncbi:hypothetical protein CXB51_023088 [Gossypium anomalum]|uniref:Uncharacterized protein n=1 Tax=Gossypium anomalum TaxID=47600 RepID=A0A8J5YTR3_9ROSI|nr:hypothetical protein CXB51_023088 [Gossypium anomalum]
MEEVTNTTTYEALINHLFCDDLFHTDFPSASSSIFMPEEPIGAQCLIDENGTNHKSTKKLKPRKIQQERRPWLNQKPSNDQSTSGNEEAKQKHKLQSPAMLWKLKMKNKKVKLGCLAGKLPPASIEAPLSDRKPPYEKNPQLASLQRTTSIPVQPMQFHCLPGYQDGNGRMSKSAAYRKLRKLGSSKEQQPSRPWLGNAGLHQPWLKQKPLDYQNNAGLVELRQTFRLQAHEMVCVNFCMLLFLLLCNFLLSRPFIFHLV